MPMKSIAKIATAMAGETLYQETAYAIQSASGSFWVDLVEYTMPVDAFVVLKAITGSMSADWSGSPLYRIVNADGDQVWPYDTNGASLPTTEASFTETIRLTDDFKIQLKSTATDEISTAAIISFKVQKLVW